MRVALELARQLWLRRAHSEFKAGRKLAGRIRYKQKYNNNDELLISFSNVVKLDLIFIFLIFFHKNIDEKLEKIE